MSRSSHRVAASAVLRVAAMTALAGCSALLSTAAAANDASVRREDQLKAAYLLNFVKFVEWPPADMSGALIVCFYGGAGVHDALAAKADGSRAANRTLSVRRLEPSSSTEGCHALYLDTESLANGRRRLPADTSPLLTVSDCKGFAHNGGMIELFTDSNRLRFNVNVANAQKAGLRISASLLQLAASVDKGSGR